MGQFTKDVIIELFELAHVVFLCSIDYEDSYIIHKPNYSSYQT